MRFAAILWRFVVMFKKNPEGFSVIEMMVAVAVIAILTAILIPNTLRAIKLSRFAKAKHFVKDISDAVEVYQAVTGRFPFDITSLTGAVPPFIDPGIAAKFCNTTTALTKVVDGYGHVCLFNLTTGGENFAYYTYADDTDGSGFYLVALYQSGANRGKYLFNETSP